MYVLDILFHLDVLMRFLSFDLIVSNMTIKQLQLGQKIEQKYNLLSLVTGVDFL